MDSKIKASFWSDAAIESLDSRQKLALLWLFTSHISNCGWATATKSRFEFETGLKWTVLERATAALGTALVRGKDGWWVRNFIRHQIGDREQLAKNNMRVAIRTSMAFAPAEIVAEIMVEYPALSDKEERASEGLQKGRGSTRAEQSRAEVLDSGKEVQEENHSPPCTIEQAKTASVAAGITEAEAEFWWESRASDHWMKGGEGSRRAVGSAWQHDMKQFTTSVRKNGGSPAGRPNGITRATPKTDTVWSLTESLKCINESITEIDSSMTGAWAELSPAKKQERAKLVERRKELRRKLSGLEETA